MNSERVVENAHETTQELFVRGCKTLPERKGGTVIPSWRQAGLLGACWIELKVVVCFLCTERRVVPFFLAGKIQFRKP